MVRSLFSIRLVHTIEVDRPVPGRRSRRRCRILGMGRPGAARRPDGSAVAMRPTAEFAERGAAPHRSASGRESTRGGKHACPPDASKSPEVDGLPGRSGGTQRWSQNPTGFLHPCF